MPEEDFNLRNLEFRLGALHDDVRDVRGSMNKLADAITKLALIEERQINTNATVAQSNLKLEAMATTVNHKLDTMEARIAQLEISLPGMSRTSMWVDRAVLFTVGAAAMFVFKAAGLIGS